MEPQIQYCRTSDGVSIAYYAIGEGPPLIVTSAGLGMSIGPQWDAGPSQRIAELTSRVFKYVRYDPRGCGLSDRDVDDFSVESYVRDLEAVADATAPETFALFANGTMTAPAIVYAAKYPERLTHFIMWMTFARGADRFTPHSEALIELAAADWRAASESLVRSYDNWEHEHLAAQNAELMRQSVTPDVWVKYERETRTWDVSEYLPRIKTPTLVIHPRNHPYFKPEIAQRVAAAIPGARLALVDSATVLFPDAKIVYLAGEFLGRVPPRGARQASPTSGTTIILFADIVDSTALTERMGDAAFRERARTLDGALRSAITAAGGTAIDGKLLGDGVLATFPAASQAIDAALRCNEAAAATDEGRAEALRLRLHIGIHAGDVIREANNVYGGAVNIASRISALSAPGEVLVSRTVAELARTSAGVTFEDRGQHALKGVADPQRVYAVRKAGA